MTNQTSTLADRSVAAHTELRTAQHRITALEAIESDKGKSISSLKTNLLFINETDRASRQQIENMIADHSAAFDAAKAERIGLQSKLTTLHQISAGFVHLARAVEPRQHVIAFEAAQAAWAEAMTPYLPLFERLRTAAQGASRSIRLLTAAELLSGHSKP
jgi:hypothetical protein